jgi:hypothetical protein
MRSYNILILGVIIVFLGISLVLFSQESKYFLVSLLGNVIMLIAIVEQNNDHKI